LTGDARYLDYGQPSTRTKEMATADDDGVAETHHQEEEGEPFVETAPADDTADLPPQRAEHGAERDNVPKVVRKQNGRYPPRNSLSRPEETHPAAEEPRNTRARRRSSDEQFLTELPEDLFDWPETRREFGSTEPPRDGQSSNE